MVKAGCTAGFEDFVVRHIWLCIANVIFQGVIKQYRILRNDPNVFSQALDLDIFYLHIIYLDGPAIGGIESKEKFQTRRFAATTVADDGGRSARINSE